MHPSVSVMYSQLATSWPPHRSACGLTNEMTTDHAGMSLCSCSPLV